MLRYTHIYLPRDLHDQPLCIKGFLQRVEERMTATLLCLELCVPVGTGRLVPQFWAVRNGRLRELDDVTAVRFYNETFRMYG